MGVSPAYVNQGWKRHQLDESAPDSGSVGPPDHRSTLMALGSVLLPAGAIGTNVGVLAGGTISVDAIRYFSACAPGAESAADPFTPQLKVLRQVAPKTTARSQERSRL